MFWRLAAKDKETNEVLVPGCFHKANAALPIAPEPLTNMVLSSMMTGLLSEFITGTPMAPLTATGNLYIGYLNMHMRAARHTALDIRRISELLASLAVWVRNLHTSPKPEEVEEMLVNWVKTQIIPSADSPGKFKPEKAYAYTLIDSKHPIDLKYSALLNETLRRYSKQLLVQSKNSDKHVNDQLAAQQVPIREFLRDLLNQLSPDTNVVEDVPISVLATAKQLASLMTESHEEEVLEYLKDAKRRQTILECVRSILVKKSSAAFPVYNHWKQVQRSLFVWWSIATCPVEELLECFRLFKNPAAYERQLQSNLALLQNDQCNNFDEVITSWVDTTTETPTHVALIMMPDMTFTTRRCSAGKFLGEFPFDNNCLIHIWHAFSALLSNWGWKGSASTCFGLHEVDYDIIRAFKNPALVEQLTQTQLSEYHSAKEWRNPAYSKFVAAKPEVAHLSSDHHFVPQQQVRSYTGKPRLSIVFIGNVDAGKSTTLGHLIYKVGLCHMHFVLNI